jgi:hypothetical protein
MPPAEQPGNLGRTDGLCIASLRNQLDDRSFDLGVVRRLECRHRPYFAILVPTPGASFSGAA